MKNSHRLKKAAIVVVVVVVAVQKYKLVLCCARLRSRYREQEQAPRAWVERGQWLALMHALALLLRVANGPHERRLTY